MCWVCVAVATYSIPGVTTHHDVWGSDGVRASKEIKSQIPSPFGRGGNITHRTVASTGSSFSAHSDWFPFGRLIHWRSTVSLFDCPVIDHFLRGKSGANQLVMSVPDVAISSRWGAYLSQPRSTRQCKSSRHPFAPCCYDRYSPQNRLLIHCVQQVGPSFHVVPLSP